jgi:hypothetical protein
MTIRYLFDECFSPGLAAAFRAREPFLEIEFIGKSGVLPKGTLDSDVLVWCEENDHLLVTNNRSTMPRHLIDHLQAGRHIPGIFQVPEDSGWAELFDELTLIAGAAMPGEYVDQIRYLPLSY